VRRRTLFAAVTAAMVLAVLALGSLPHPTRIERPGVEAAAARAGPGPIGSTTTTTTEVPAATVTPGRHAVGPLGVGAGTYVTSGDLCTWERGGAAGDVLATDTVTGQALVEVRATDATFSSSPECGTWRSFDPRGPAAPLPSFGAGTFAVGAQVAPGRWRSDGGNLCYWERLSGLGGELDELADSAGVVGPTEVVLAPTDVAFSSFGCGTWHLVG
jgi:hypothetical protein